MWVFVLVYLVRKIKFRSDFYSFSDFFGDEISWVQEIVDYLWNEEILTESGGIKI